MSNSKITGETSGRRTAGRSAAPSLATLSAHLGLSQAAISRVLNGVPAAESIPQMTQERIFAAAKAFNYRPNALARSLRRGRSMTIGVLVPEVSDGYATLVLAGLEQVLLEAEYIYFLVSHHHRCEAIERSEAVFLERSVDGLVAIDTPFTWRAHLPIVTVSSPREQEGVTHIVLDHELAAKLAVEHLVELGHRKVAVIKGQVFSSDTGPRFQATAAALQRAGLGLTKHCVVQLEGDAPTHEPGYLATQRLLAAGAAFTAVLAFNDVSAIGAVRALREAGLRVPEEVSVVGFDDVQSAAFQNPALTTVRQPLRAMGRLAAETVLRQIAMPGTGAGERLVVAPEFVMRDSTARRRLDGLPARVR